ncbi:DUF5336 domain-containing protein [Phaeacidiphilus oryzae]|uniref:DUF5336 domain-containing protein n=1 Tax=Phaeacidiphilus oryzae TaxID=348818 RepID=UPI000561B5C2|nr:DUF5336 domain-containing protein [Phaeacidiphilus oryzae]
MSSPDESPQPQEPSGASGHTGATGSSGPPPGPPPGPASESPSGPPQGPPPESPPESPWGGSTPGAGPLTVSLADVCYLLTALLGIACLFLGFTTITSDGYTDLSFFNAHGLLGWVPALLFLGGLAAIRPVLPSRGARADGSLPLIATAAGIIPFAFGVLATDHGGYGLQTGETLMLVFGLLQLVFAAAALYLRTVTDLRRRNPGSGFRWGAGQPVPPPPPPRPHAPRRPGGPGEPPGRG